jgi:hypothetical protein
MAERVILHIGVHKTGTTAFQRWAYLNRDELESRFDLHVYRSLFGWNSHIEFPLLCVGPFANLPMRTRFPDSVLPSWQREARAHIEAELSTPARTCLVSAEGLAYLRSPEELASLDDLIGPREKRIVVVVRDKRDFLASYREEMSKHGHKPSKYPDSFAYVEDDTWVARFDDLIAAYSQAFGSDQVSVIQYEEAIAATGSTIPAIAMEAGLSAAELPSWDGVWTNASTKRSQVHAAHGLWHRLRSSVSARKG